MEPESSLPYSQAPATCAYPEPTPSSPHKYLSYYLELHFASEIMQRISIKFGIAFGAKDSQNLRVLCEVNFQLHYHLSLLVGLIHGDNSLLL